jgi:hypothetical protein
VELGPSFSAAEVEQAAHAIADHPPEVKGETPASDQRRRPDVDLALLDTPGFLDRRRE